MNSMSGEKLKGIPYTGTLPAVLAGTKAGYLHSYKIYGNTEQVSETPTPENPIYPSECGERTGNIWTLTATDFSESTVVVGAAKEVTISGLTPNTQYTLTSNIRKTDSDGSCLWFNGTSPTNGVWNGQSRTAVSSANGELKVYYRSVILPEFNNYWYMLNEGSTALPYEPYGYKLPLLSGSTPVDIYIGESQTTRWIKKLVLDGTENWQLQPNRTQTFKISISYAAAINCISSHYTPIYLQSFDVKSGIYARSGALCVICDMNCQNLTDFKTYLQQQYANGTPVTVWYVLATEEIGILNEPLRKIGDYADTIDSTQTSAQIPTSANSTTISWAGQGLAPSEFDSIQEWVDTPTYKRVNGEWVADN